MKRLNILFCALLLISFFACKDEEPEGPFYDDAPPVFTIMNANSLVDTMKISAGEFYSFSFAIQDDRNEWELSFTPFDEGLVYLNEVVVSDAPSTITVDNGKFDFRALEAGSAGFSIIVKDEAGLSSNATVDIEVIDNYLPVANLTLEQTDEVAPYQVMIDASASIDADEKWGGGIVEYEYELVGFYTTITDRDQIDYIYPEPGLYEVKLRAKDTDGAWSDQVIELISVQ